MAEPGLRGSWPAPKVTRTERRVLIELCRPLMSYNAPQPASLRDIGNRLFVGKNAVQAHLANLYGKFGLNDGSIERRVALAHEAIRRGIVTKSDFPDDEDSPDNGDRVGDDDDG